MIRDKRGDQRNQRNVSGQGPGRTHNEESDKDQVSSKEGLEFSGQA